MACKRWASLTSFQKWCVSGVYQEIQSFLWVCLGLGRCLESACNVGDLSLIPGLVRSPEEGKGYPVTPAFWPGEFHRLYSPTESDTTERLSLVVSYKTRHTLSMCVCSDTQLCPTLCSPMDCSPPGSSVHGISWTRILEWEAIPSSRGSSRARDGTHVSYVSCTGRRILHHRCRLRSQELCSSVFTKRTWKFMFMKLTAEEYV